VEDITSGLRPPHLAAFFTSAPILAFELVCALEEADDTAVLGVRAGTAVRFQATK
jgi:ABC-type phosphate/phosphonate transport system permease subunit